MNFPHLQGSNAFPGVENVRVYDQYPNSFDYTRWAADTKILLCSVRWDGATNVVEWASRDARDEWFAGLDGYRDTLQTELRILPDGMIKVPLPFDAGGLYNYVWVEFPRATSQTQPLDHEPETGVRAWGFFIEGLRYRSPSCTELDLSVDWWTTFAGQITINSMQLSRGHYALAQAADVETYLADPIDSTDWLLAPEPTQPARLTRVHDTSVFNLNGGSMMVVFDISGASIETGDWTTPTVPSMNRGVYNIGGVPGGNLIATDVANFDTIGRTLPQAFWQCVRACYIIDSQWLYLEGTVEWRDVTWHYVTGGMHVEQDVHVSQDDFSYPDEYADLTKLYTGAYAQVEVVTESGQTITADIEELGSTQRIDAVAQVTSAGLAIVAIANGIGSSEYTRLTFRLLNNKHIPTAGAWQDAIMRWDIPSYAVYQSNEDFAEVTKVFERNQARLNASVAYDNAVASATTANTNALAANSTAQANALASNSTAQTNADNAADNLTANNAVTVAANTAIVTESTTNATTGAGYSDTKLRTDVQYDIGNSNASFDASMAQLGVAATNNNSQAMVSGISGVAHVIGSALSGNLGGAVSAAGDMVNSGASWAASNASITVSQSNNANVYNQAVTSAYGKQDSAIKFNDDSTALNNSTATANAATNNDASTSIASNDSSLTKTNAANTKATADANANRTKTTGDANANRSLSTAEANAERTRDNALAAVTAGINTDNVHAPHAFGRVDALGTRGVVPMCATVRVRTAATDEIARAGDSMLRYGYTCNRAVHHPTTLKVMPHYSFWQASEIWLSANGKAPQVALDNVRDVLVNGVTVWGNPDEIGEVSIYDNR